MEDIRFDSSGASDCTMVDVAYAGVAQMTLSKDKFSPLESVTLKGPGPEMLVASTPDLTDELGNN